ncbi:MAG: hypothetical protein EOS81_04715 [Mesorhizobium sp.]|uniref:SDH family Clp fold serine proteinase n=1 Tax=Mesorhizobium sp. TaxID=1871066 RepID=UPI000FD3B140|nr:hypothetical protein EN759_04265 [Mesorhizobium sp. M00.F.Ca.ET.038.03.1.1]RWF05391.1 MAG: hypothetical protein EOS81_04715 [Mesorhizobium sp.]
MAGSSSSKTNLGKLGLKASKEYSSDIYVYAGTIDEKGYEALRNEVLFSRRSENAILVLITTGGSGSAAFKIARLFQTFYDKFDVFIPAQCKSAGTLLAIGAHRLWMSPFAELGPIDAQITQPGEIGVPDSILSTRASVEAIMATSFQFFESAVSKMIAGSDGAVGFRQAAEIGSSLTAHMMSSLFAKVDPALLGRHDRRGQEAIEYGDLLASMSGNAADGTVVSLAQNYPCHDFVIDFVQAKSLFRHVERAEGTLLALASELGEPVAHGSEGIIDIRTLHRTKLPKTVEMPDFDQAPEDCGMSEYGAIPDYGEMPSCDETADVAAYADWFAGRHQANDCCPNQADELSQKAA